MSSAARRSATPCSATSSFARRIRRISTCAVLVACGIADEVSASDGRWDIAAPLPQAVTAAATAELGGKFYVVSGTNTSASRAFDPATGTWSDKASLPVTTPYAGAAVVGGKLYLVGGGGGSIGSSTIWIYDPVGDGWSQVAGGFSPWSGIAVDAIGTKIYAAGGQNQSHAAQQTLKIYDTVTNSWSDGPNLAVARNGAAAATIAGKLYVAGGSMGANYTTSLEVYDPVANAWTSKSPLPVGLYAAGAVEANGLLYVIGGIAQGGIPSAAVLVYDPAADTWSTCMAPCPTAHSFTAPRRVGNEIHIAGGGPNNTLVTTHEAYTVPWEVSAPLPAALTAPATAELGGKFYVVSGTNTSASRAFDPATGTWSDKASLPVTTPYAGAAVVGGKLYLIGGGGGSVGSSTIWIYDPVGDGWSQVAGGFSPWSGIAVDAIGTKIYAAGGQNQSHAAQQTLKIYDTVANSWSDGPNMGVARNGAAAATIAGKLYVAGGSMGANYTTSLEVYDPVANTWTSKSPLPIGLYAAGAVEANGLLYVIGGIAQGGIPSAAVLVYDPAADAWSTCTTPCPTAHSFTAPRRIGNEIHIAGGGPNNTLVTTHEVYDVGCAGGAGVYGTGCAGSGSLTPALHVGGCLEPGGIVQVAVLEGLGGSTALILFGLVSGSTPMGGGCSLLVSPLLPISLSLPLSGTGPGAGHIVIAAPLPLDTAVPLAFTLQAFVADNGVPRGFSASNGVLMNIDD